MKIKVFTPQGYKIVTVEVQDDVKSISKKFRECKSNCVNSRS